METNLKKFLEIDDSRKISAIRLIKNFAIDNQMYECAAAFRIIEREMIIENNRNIKIGSSFFDSDKSVPMIDGIDQYLYAISLIENININKIEIMEFLDKIRIELRDEKINKLLK